MNKTIIKNEFQRQNITLNNRYILLDAYIDELLENNAQQSQIAKLIDQYIRFISNLSSNKSIQYTYFDPEKVKYKKLEDQTLNIMRIIVDQNHSFYVFADSFQEIKNLSKNQIQNFCFEQLEPQFCYEITNQQLEYGYFTLINNFICQNVNRSEHKHLSQNSIDLIQHYLFTLNNMKLTVINPNLYPFQLFVYFSIKCDKFQSEISKNFCLNQKFQTQKFQQILINEQLNKQFYLIKQGFDQLKSFQELFLFTDQEIRKKFDFGVSNQILNCMDSFLFKKQKYQEIIKQCIEHNDFIQHGAYLYDLERQKVISANASLIQDFKLVQQYARVYDNITFTNTLNWCLNLTNKLQDAYIYPNNQSTEVWKIDQEHGLRMYNTKYKQFPLQINQFQQLYYVGQYPLYISQINNSQGFDFLVWRQSVDQTYIKVISTSQKKLQVTCHLFDEAGHNFTYTFNTGKNDIRLIPTIMESYRTYQEASQFQREFITCNGVTKQFEKKGLEQNSYFKELELDKFIQKSREIMKQNQAGNELELLQLNEEAKNQKIYIYFIVIFITLVILQYIE